MIGNTTKNKRKITPINNNSNNNNYSHHISVMSDDFKIDDDEYEKNKKDLADKHTSIDWIGFSLLLIVILISICTCPSKLVTPTVTLQQVWYYGWITAISTGLGAIPFFFITEPNKYWIGVSNAIAGGMMIAASFSLVFEGSTFAEEIIERNDVNFIYSLSPILRTLLGFLIGIAFILSTKKLLAEYEHIKLGELDSINAKKMVLIVFVMTLHSLTEGVGIGVSFGGKGGNHLGQFISLSLAVHNIPEGLAVALVLTSRKVSNMRAGLWAIFTSLPQPLMALPSFIFVDHFIPMLPIGLGFASGAMANVAIFELLVEAVEDTSYLTTGIVSILSFCLMILIQESVKIAI